MTPWQVRKVVVELTAALLIVLSSSSLRFAAFSSCSHSLSAICASTCFVMILYVKVHGERGLLRCDGCVCRYFIFLGALKDAVCGEWMGGVRAR